MFLTLDSQVLNCITNALTKSINIMLPNPVILRNRSPQTPFVDRVSIIFSRFNSKIIANLEYLLLKFKKDILNNLIN